MSLSIASVSSPRNTFASFTNCTAIPRAVSYQLGAAKLTASYAKGKIEDTATTTNSMDTKATQFGAEYAIGKFRPFAITGKSTNVLASSGATTFDAKSSQFGVRYDLSKRTIAYVMSGKVTDSGTLNAAAATTIAERKATAIGLYHAF
jgi:predicted porin